MAGILPGEVHDDVGVLGVPVALCPAGPHPGRVNRARPTWSDLPAVVRAALEEIVGGQVTAWSSQPSGYSPGLADRVTAATGDRYFVKAVNAHEYPDTAVMHRREIRITGRLPEGVASPRLVGSYEGLGWVAMVLSDIDGRHPQIPWVRAEAEAALALLGDLAAATTPCPIQGLPDAAPDLAQMFLGWERLDIDSDRGNWIRHAAALRDLARHACSVVAGATVVHLDVRDDNLLIDTHGRMWLVDWPWAAIGADWLDAASALISIAHGGGVDPLALIDSSRQFGRTPADDIDGYLSGLAVFVEFSLFAPTARNPHPACLPSSSRTDNPEPARPTSSLVTRECNPK